MNRTPEQDEANKLLSEAIERACTAHNIFPEHAMVMDYVVTVEAATLDEQGDYHSEFFGLCFPSSNTRTTIALGLLEKGKELLRHGERVADDDG